jgi:hypothetical protein
MTLSMICSPCSPAMLRFSMSAAACALTALQGQRDGDGVAGLVEGGAGHG